MCCSISRISYRVLDDDIRITLDHSGNSSYLMTATAAIDITHTPATELHISRIV